MENNSIKSNLTKDYIISDLKLSLSEDVYRENVFIVVEGENDIKFLKSYLNFDNTFLYESYDGKNGVSEIVNNFFPDDKRVIGIRDRDYLEDEESPKIFFYDNCCLEMMIIENETSFNSIYNEFYKGDMQLLELRDKILKELKFISIIRMLNERSKWEINLKALSINKVFRQDSYSIDNEEVVSELNRIDNNILDEEKIEKINEYANQAQSFQELLQITQGHDFSSLFAAICNIDTNKHIKPQSVEMALRCSFRMEDFQETRLHNFLLTYQKTINIVFLKCVNYS